MTKVDIGGGYYEINKDININKLIAGIIYFSLIKISFILWFMKKEVKKIVLFLNIIIKLWWNIIKYFTYIIDNIETNYVLVELKSDKNLEKIIIKNKITNSDYSLYNRELKNINKINKTIPYYFSIIAKQYQKININIKLNYLSDNPFEFIEICEYPNRFEYKSYNNYTNKSTNFIRENNNI